MFRARSACRHTLLLLALAVVAPAIARGQLIAPKTVPVHQGEQFGIYPSQWPGMGGVSIALADTIGDLWLNPAKATRLSVGSVQIMPFSHHATAGGGRSLPISLLQTGGKLAGGALFTLQEVERTEAWWDTPTSERRASNAYYSGVLALRAGDVAIGAGLSYADLRGVDGVDALYAGSRRLVQSGNQVDARIGFTRDFASGATLEITALRNRYRMSHDVTYPTAWDLPQQCGPWGGPLPPECEPVVIPERNELNLDRTNTSGVHAVYLAPPRESGWRVGYVLTANRLSHPKIPNYRIQSIPRDPGNTNAINFGFGLARSLGPTTFGLDVIMEPMWSDTWADAANDTTNANGGVIPQGAHTVDNRFRFLNSRINVGLAYDVPASPDSPEIFQLQFGLAVRSINYTLDQSNHVLLQSRTQDEAWMEWTPTFAARIKSRNYDLSYSYSYTCGPRCLSSDDVFFAPPPATPDGPPVIAAPSAPLNFDGGSSSRHRLTLSLRLW